MRTFVLTLAFIAAATPAFATCTPIKPTGDRATDLANEQALTLCLAAELHARTAQQSQQLQIQADLQAQTNNLTTGVSSNWGDYPAGNVSPVIVDMDAANGSVFFRLAPQ